MILLNDLLQQSSVVAFMNNNLILGSYQQRDYSEGFQKMMSKVVSKINQKKTSKQSSPFKTLVEFIPNDNPLNLRISKIGYAQEINPRKNSSPISHYSMFKPKPNGFIFRAQRYKYSISTQRSHNKGSKSNRSKTLPHGEIQHNLYRKISEYNTCLLARTYKFQQKQKLAVCIQNDRSQRQTGQSPPTISKIKRCEKVKRNSLWVQSRNKFIQGSPPTPKIQEQFRPWESEFIEQIQF